MSEMKTALKPWVIINMLLIIVVGPLIPMIISGDWGWVEAWGFAIVSILTFAISRVIAGRKHPDLIAERAKYMSAADTKSWDKLLAPLLGIGFILVLVVAGLDRYYNWSQPFPAWLKILAFVLLVLGYGISSWALVENRFFSGTVRIQSERGQHVVSTGPYKYVRHPGYAGGLLGYVFIPVLLDSCWAYMPAILLGIVLVVRTRLEDKTLIEELPGYREFTEKTRYRLIPGLW